MYCISRHLPAVSAHSIVVLAGHPHNRLLPLTLSFPVSGPSPAPPEASAKRFAQRHSTVLSNPNIPSVLAPPPQAAIDDARKLNRCGQAIRQCYVGDGMLCEQNPKGLRVESAGDSVPPLSFRRHHSTSRHSVEAVEANRCAPIEFHPLHRAFWRLWRGTRCCCQHFLDHLTRSICWLQHADAI